jgi:creatinine amidohydrolase
MPVHRLADMTWEDARDALEGDCVAVLPVGAVEAHGPHLPLGTDVIIAEGMARACAEELSAQGVCTLVLPPLWYTAAAFARGFPGTVGIDGGTVTRTVKEIAGALGAQGVRTLALANAHLDPAHLASLHACVGEHGDGTRVVFLDLTRRAVASRLTEEFQTGACHAGCFEGSVVLAEAPELVRTEIAQALEPNPSSLSGAIGGGIDSFEDAGGPRAYFGWPAEATAEEGRETVRLLGALLAEAVRAESGRAQGAAG